MECSDKPKNKNSDKVEEETINKDTEENANADVNANAELMKQLCILDLSINTSYVILLAVILDINFVKGERVKLLDQINKTNLSKGLPDLSDIPRITNIMFLYSTGVFLDIDYNAYKEVASVKGKKRDPRAIRRAWKNFLSTLLTLIATAISRDNLEL